MLACKVQERKHESILEGGWDYERWEMMKEAGAGGSVKQEYREVVGKLVREGKLKLWEWTVIQHVRWDQEEGKWILTLSENGRDNEISVDEMVYATGETANIGSVEAIRPILQQYPIDIVGGMPCLTNELMWNKDVPLFVTGKLGGLRLGPATGNPEGARLGAEFIASKIAEISLTWRIVHSSHQDSVDEIDMSRLGLGRSNQFEALEAHIDEEGSIRSMI